MTKKGCFITFEGADGCGKTTQLELCAEYLKESGYDVVVTREPGALELGKEIRKILLHYEGDVSPNAEMFLFLADRANHIDMLIKPAIEAGKIVLCDRHTDSTISYQGYGRGNDIEQIKKLNAIATAGIQPDLTLVYDVDTEVAQSRVGEEKDRMEASGIEFHKRVRNGYLELAKVNPERIKLIDANSSIKAVFSETKSTIDSFLS